MIERLGKELMKHSIDVCLVYQSIDPAMLSRFEDANIRVVKASGWSRKEIIPLFDPSDISYAVTFIWNDFLICNINKDYLRTVFYAVHYYAFRIGNNRGIFLKRILKRIVGKGIECLISNRQLLCMDEQTIEKTQDYYGLNRLEIPIIRVAVDEAPLISRAKDGSVVHILAISRADFPFKGYIIGLIDWVIGSGKDVAVTIISYGEGEKEIKEKIASLDADIRQRINLVGKTDYDQLQQYYENADLYVGMGTTLLDASLRGIVSVPVKAYTYELTCDSFFYENCFKLSVDEGTSSGFDELFDRYAGLGLEDRELVSQKGREVVLHNYSTPVIVTELLNRLSTIRSNSSTIGLEMIRTYHTIKSVINGDYKNAGD